MAIVMLSKLSFLVHLFSMKFAVAVRQEEVLKSESLAMSTLELAGEKPSFSKMIKASFPKTPGADCSLACFSTQLACRMRNGQRKCFIKAGYSYADSDSSWCIAPNIADEEKKLCTRLALDAPCKHNWECGEQLGCRAKDGKCKKTCAGSYEELSCPLCTKDDECLKGKCTKTYVPGPPYQPHLAREYERCLGKGTKMMIGGQYKEKMTHKVGGANNQEYAKLLSEDGDSDEDPGEQ